MCEISIVIFHTITLEIVHSHPRYHGLANASQHIKCTLCDRRAAVWIHTGSAPLNRISEQRRHLVTCASFGVLGRWRGRHTRPARWSDTLRIRPVRWRKWNRIRIDLARLADPITTATLAYTRYTETRPPEMISDWSPPTNMEVCLQYFCFLSEEFTSHSQHRHADNAPTIPMSRPNVRAHRRRLVTACHACETIF